MKTLVFRLAGSLMFILIASAARADRIKNLAEPKAALAAFATTIAEARASVDLATFILEPCEPSVQILLDLLAEKARAGVKVRVLIDGFMQKGEKKRALVSFLTDAGAQVRFYNPNEPNMRMHAKLLVVDGLTYISGGRNISDRYFALSSSINYVDRDLLVRGSSAEAARASFNELWSAQLASRAPASGRFAGWGSACENTLARQAQIQNLLRDQSAGLLDALPEHQCRNVSFVTDHPDFGSAAYAEGASQGDPYMNEMRLNRKLTTKTVLEFLGAARTSLSLENWVYMPMNMLDGVFASLRSRKVNVQVITNEDTEDGPALFREAMDYAIKYHSDRDSKGTQRVRRISSKGSLSAAFELTPANAPFFMHGKLAVRDGRDVAVGSFNLDSRSYSTNVESSVIVENCPSLAADVRAHTAALHAMFEDDAASGRVPKKKEASFAAKMMAMFGLVLM